MFNYDSKDDIDAWKNLQQEFIYKNQNQILCLQVQLLTQKKKNGEKFESFLHRIVKL